MGKSLKKIPFDQYSRQYQVAEIINTVRKNKESFKILDVGGYKGRTSEFLDKDTVTVMDLYDSDESNYVKGSALEMPFDDDEFDIVTSFDVLEHIPGNKRELFVSECLRVSKRGCIIAAPHLTDENTDAEKQLNALYKQLHGKDHEWLSEHIENGLPDFERIRRQVEAKGYKTTISTSNDTLLWMLMQGAIFLNSKSDMASADLVKLNVFYNEHLPHDGSTEAESYRLIFCIIKDEEDFRVIKALNTPKTGLTLAEKTRLATEIENYTTTLLAKHITLSDNYKNLYEHEKKRATTLEELKLALENENEHLKLLLQKPLKLLKHKVKASINKS